MDKPAGMTTVRHKHEAAEHGERAQQFLPPTLADVLPGMLARGDTTKKREGVRAVHRLDKDTSGLVVFARTAEAKRHLGLQMRKHSIERQYLALVRGQAKSEQIVSKLVRDRGDGRRGSTDDNDSEGKRAVTNVSVIEELRDFTLVECRLETGRTHQVRIHLGERGTPLCGERIYDRPLDGPYERDTSGANRTMLHACFLSIDHPETGKTMKWSSSLPPDMKELLQDFRKAAKRESASDNESQQQNLTRGKLSDRFGKSK
ncbi:MAG: RluA family pseudouridine synthase [Gemmataceae bacterium]